ncbi:MAG: alpha/beta hydrolase [Roseiarcus sp.]|jgi:pimeloyl-ACP methyl ester carboxylesterase
MVASTIVFVHGMFMTPLCWEGWTARFTALGYRCLAPAWPGRERSVAELNAAHPDPALGRLTLTDVVDSMVRVLASLDDKPIVVGHSMGGLVTQILVNRDLAAAGVALHPAPPAGVFALSWPLLRCNWPMISPFVDRWAPRAMSFEDFQYAFVNTLPLAAQKAAYDRYVVPESRMVPRDSLGAIGRVDFRKPHAPLLITAGEKDHIVPAVLNRANVAKYRRAGSGADFREFPGRDHFGLGAPGWEEIADFVAARLPKA